MTARQVTYNIDSQINFINAALNVEDLYTENSKFFSSDLFDSSIKMIIDYMNDTYSLTSHLPSPSQVNNHYHTDFVGYSDLASTNDEEMKEAYRQEIRTQVGYFEKHFKDFARYTTLRNAITKAHNDIDDTTELADIQRSIDDAFAACDTSKPVEFGVNTVDIINQLVQTSAKFTTGFKALDDVVGKMGDGELLIYAGGSASGKSILLQNNFLTHWKDNKNVLYVSLELSETRVMQRILTMCLGLEKYQIEQNPQNTQDQLEQYKADNSINSRIFLKYMDSGSTAADVKNLVRSIERTNNLKIDIVIVDYLDLLSPIAAVNASDTFLKDKLICEDLRKYASQSAKMIVTASQLNRQSIKVNDLDHSHIAGGVSKINTADLVIGILHDPARRDLGIFDVQIMKTRNSAGTARKLELAINPKTLRIKDGATPQTPIQATPSQQTASIKASLSPERVSIDDVTDADVFGETVETKPLTDMQKMRAKLMQQQRDERD